jgi:hypothetical protein
MNISTIGTNNHGEKCYRVYLATGTMWLKVFQAYAYNESEAIDLVADYCESEEFKGLYSDYYELADLCETGQSVDEYAEAHNLICCGNHGIYLEVAGLEEITNDETTNA